MATLDIFKADGFSMTSLTDRVNKMPFVPGQAGRLGIYKESGVSTTTFGIEEYNGVLNLIPNQTRGGNVAQNQHKKRVYRYLTIPHLPLEDRILPEEIQNVRAFGSESELQGVQNVLDLRLKEMLNKHDATVEYQRIRAIQGIILDSDGATVIYNLFTEFGVAQQTLDMVLGTATTQQLTNALTIKNDIEDELGQIPYDGVYCFCGRTFFQRFVTHATVQTAYQYYLATNQNNGAQPLRDDQRYSGFNFGGITWVQYRGKVGGNAYVADTEAYAFPTGVEDMFATHYAPADFMETVNTIGLPRYVKLAPDPLFNRYMDVHTQSNPLSICKRPRAVIKLTSSN